MLLVEMMADLDEEVAELFLMEEEVRNLDEIVNGLDPLLKVFGMVKTPSWLDSGCRLQLALCLSVKQTC